jgi:ribosomal protein S18 acetylase RimI-like enzyme
MMPAAPREVPETEFDDVVAVLADSFFEYPVMRWVIGRSPAYGEHLRMLVGYFLAARYARGETVLGVGSSGALVGVALVSRPGPVETSDALARRREAVWSTLGPDARERYERFGAAASTFDVDVPHLHLNMIGVRTSARGSGLARVLLVAVHRRAADDPEAEGVSLTTEVAANVDLYRYFGYRIVGEARLEGAFTSWGMYRSNSRPGEAYAVGRLDDGSVP